MALGAADQVARRKSGRFPDRESAARLRRSSAGGSWSHVRRAGSPAGAESIADLMADASSPGIYRMAPTADRAGSQGCVDRRRLRRGSEWILIGDLDVDATFAAVRKPFATSTTTAVAIVACGCG